MVEGIKMGTVYNVNFAYNKPSSVCENYGLLIKVLLFRKPMLKGDSFYTGCWPGK